MKILLIVIGVLILFLGYHLFQVQRKIKISRQLVKQTTPYQKMSEDFSTTLLVLGDSTAAGVGVNRPEDSVPARYSNFIGATYTENKAISGSKIIDTAKQLSDIQQKQYAHILIQAGSNDIVAYKNVKAAEHDLRILLQSLPPHEKLTVIMCGNVGAAKLIPWFLRNLYTRKTLEYHHMYEKAVVEFGGTYVNLYTPKSQDPFVQEPKKYLAKDEFHPSSEGYALWFEKISQALSRSE